MIPVRYALVRWIIAGIGIAIGLVWYYALVPAGLQVWLAFLLILTAMSWVVPPGIFAWLIRGVCPTCGKNVEWAAVNPPDRPYYEQIVIRCPECNKSRVEWQYGAD